MPTQIMFCNHTSPSYFMCLCFEYQTEDDSLHDDKCVTIWRDGSCQVIERDIGFIKPYNAEVCVYKLWIPKGF